MFLSPEIILSTDSHDDVLKQPVFRRCLAAVAVDEVHLVSDWSTFRPRFHELHILRARLPSSIPYLGVSATLDKDTLDIVRRSAGYGNCKLIKTSIDRPEISMQIVYMEGNQRDFEDLRRFFPIRATSPYDIPKTVFYFDSKNEIRNFLGVVIDSWFPEWEYPPSAVQWIKPFFTEMAQHDKDRFARMFERSDNQTEPTTSSSIRFLVCTEAYGLGADNPDIHYVVHWKIPKNKHSLAQRMGRAARKFSPTAKWKNGHFFLVVPRWACEKAELRKTARGYVRNPDFEAFILNQSDSETNESDVDKTNPSRLAKSNQEKRNKE